MPFAFSLGHCPPGCRHGGPVRPPAQGRQLRLAPTLSLPPPGAGCAEDAGAVGHQQPAAGTIVAAHALRPVCPDTH